MSDETSADDPEFAPEPKALTPGQRETRLLPCRLDDAEMIVAARAAVEAWHLVQREEQNYRDTTADLREIVKAARVAHEKAMQALETGKGEKPVACEERLDYEAGVVIVERLDVSEDDPDRVVERRAMTEEERQGNLPLAVDGAGQVYDPSEFSDDDSRPFVCPHCGQDHPADECPQGAAPQQVENIEGRRKRRKA